MKAEDFNNIVSETFGACKEVLVRKAGEYAADDDRLANFKIAAGLQDINPIEALGGMMAKHIVSIYDFINETSGDATLGRPLDKWDEKIIDAINYLILLRGLLYE